MGTEDVKVTAMNMYNYKERLRLYKRWPCQFPPWSEFFSVLDRNLALHVTLYSVNPAKVQSCIVNLALKKRKEKSLSFLHRPYIAILMMFDCVYSEYPDTDYVHYRN